MLKFVTIIGARPQFIKAAAISRVFRNKGNDRAREILVHTGQHYDENMSKVFFDQMEIPAPDYNLEVGSGTHGHQTGKMIMEIEAVLLKEKPDMVIVYGDTNSTLSGAVAAAKLHIPVAHIEAGLRSFNKKMPEEINRIVADHASTLLFTPTRTGLDNLLKEGFPEKAEPPYSANNPKIYHCGDVMYDNTLYFSNIAEETCTTFNDIKVNKGNYVLCTIHRDSNTDVPGRLNTLISSLNRISLEFNIPVVLPLHPRTRKMIQQHLHSDIVEEVSDNANLVFTDPVSYLDMLLLEKYARIIVTDSGGVQKESYFFQKPCIVLRKESEWRELLDAGTAMLADADGERIMTAFKLFYDNPPEKFPAIFGDGRAAEFIYGKAISLFT
jgi:UDP-GlcNAc3NAcA epimerase